MPSTSDLSRPSRHANAAPPVASSIPPAPPLPPTRPAQATARSAFARFVQPFSGYGSSRPVSSQTNRDGSGGRPVSYGPPNTSFSPLSSQTTTLKTRGASEIAALDINQDRTHAILAGREILETVRVSGTTPVEETNIRAAVINHDRHNATRHRDNLDIHDVKWSHSTYATTIATAATNGKVVIYDLNRPGVEVVRLHEHTRQVHKVAFNPHHGALLLSCSQDATVRLWDLREMKPDVMNFQSRIRFMGQSDGVRDVRWSPTDVLEFAFGTDLGVVQRWDSRYAKSPKLKINAHDGMCTAIDWHPDGKHLMSAGKDKNLKVWDLLSDQRRQKAAWTLRTPYPVANARWRPPCWGGDDRGQGNWQCTQVITSYERNYSIMHLWDFRRPFMPFRQLWTSGTAPTDMLWHSTDLLWSVGREGTFHQTDVKYTVKTIERRPLTTFAISPIGELVVFSQKRPKRRASDWDYAIPMLGLPGTSRGGAFHNPPLDDMARSSADDTLDDSFLSSSFPKHHERTLSNRSTKSVAGTPPSLKEIGVAKLSETLNDNKSSYRPQQIAFRGWPEGITSFQAFSYLAQKYKMSALPDTPTVEDYLNAHKAFEQNAKYAEKTSSYRTGQTWRMFGTVLQGELRRRAVHNKKVRLGLIEAKSDETLVLPDVLDLVKNHKRSVMEPPAAMKLIQGRDASISGVRTEHQRLQASPGPQESTSNQPTPIARPTRSSSHPMSQHPLPDPDHAEQLSLPPAVMFRSSVGGKDSLSEADHGSKELKGSEVARPSFKEPDWYSSATDLEERKAMLSNYRAPAKTPLDLTPSKQTSAINIPPPLDRHNSDESFAMFSTSTDSRGGTSIPASYSSVRKRSMGSIPENMETYNHPHRASSYESEAQGSEEAIPAVLECSNGSSSQDDAFTTYKAGKLAEFRNEYQMLDTAGQTGAHSNMEASGTIVPDGHAHETPRRGSVPIVVTRASPPNSPEVKNQSHKPDMSIHARLMRPEKLDVAALAKLEKAPFIVEDFTETRWLVDNLNYPISVGKCLEEIFMYNVKRIPDTQSLFHLIALLKPFLPGSTVICPDTPALAKAKRLQDTKELLEGYAKFCLNDLNLTPDDTVELLTDPLAHLVRFRITPQQVESVCNTYLEELQSGMLWNSAVQLKELCLPSFGTFKAASLAANSSVTLICISCHKPIRRKDKKCDSCGQGYDPCPVCQQKYSPFTSTKRAKKEAEARAVAELSKEGEASSLLKSWPILWQSCLSCGHGSHLACMEQMQGVKELAGRCPASCGCPCLPGPYRDECVRHWEEEDGRRGAGSVRKDERTVGESSAVRGVRGILEEGKRVRVVEPEK